MQSTYQGILKQALAERTRANPAYSLRTFARDLGLAPSTLSEVLRGQKGLSPKKSIAVTNALQLPAWQTSYFHDLVTQSHGRTPEEKQKASERIKAAARDTKLQNLKSDTTRALTSWLSLAILECVHLKDFEPSESWLAARLRVSVKEIRETRDLLLQVKLLEIEPDGKWKDLSPYFTSSDGVPSEAIRSYHRSMLRLAENKLEQDSIEDRVLKSVVCSLEESQLPEARRILDEAISRVMSLAAEKEGGKDHVVCFGSQLFFLAKGKV